MAGTDLIDELGDRVDELDAQVRRLAWHSIGAGQAARDQAGEAFWVGLLAGVIVVLIAQRTRALAAAIAELETGGSGDVV